MNYKQLELAQKEWAYAYKDLMNRPDIRARVIYSDELMHVNLKNKKSRANVPDGSRGTVEQTMGFVRGLGHYMAFRVDDQGHVEVYDPAPIGTTFAVDADVRLSELTAFFTPRKVYMFDGGHQIHKDDTWCQTWSAAWLDNTLRSRLPPTLFTRSRSIRVMHGILFSFVNRLHNVAPDILSRYINLKLFDFRVFEYFYKNRNIKSKY